MRALIIRWLSIFIAVLIAAALLPVFTQPLTLGQAAIFAAILALLNIFIKPIIALVTCPINILTLGLFTLIINALGIIYFIQVKVLTEGYLVLE